MCSTRRSNRTVLLAAAALLAASGCATKQPPPPEPVSHAPLIVDDAMRARQWPISVAHYANGQTPAWPTGSLLKHPDTEPYWQATVTDTPMFVANSLAQPIVFLFTPPWQRVVYHEYEIEASYNGMPPLSAK